MKFFKYWAPGEATVDTGGRPWTLRAYGVSDQCLDAAKRQAREVAQRAAAAILTGPLPHDYAYGDRPMREEVVEELTNGGQVIGVISRNSYGALVLNTSAAMFVDVDYDINEAIRNRTPVTLGSALAQLWGQLTGRPKAGIAPPTATGDDALLERFERVTRSHAGLGTRVYRTAGGFRLLVTSEPFDPGSAEAAQLLDRFGADSLYRRLCLSQQCFRARLTAKFWRCGATKPPSRFPWTSAAEEADYRQWEQAYHERANRHATCAPIASFGEPTVHATIRPILDLHDRLTINDGAPLG
jgi:hypothetical protein